MLLALTTIISFQLLGTFIQQFFGSPIPGAVIGMILFFIFLCLTGSQNSTSKKTDELIKTGAQLLKHLPLLFIPAGVGIVVYTSELREHGVAILASLTIGSVIAFVITLLIFHKLTNHTSKSQ